MTLENLAARTALFHAFTRFLPLLLAFIKNTPLLAPWPRMLIAVGMQTPCRSFAHKVSTKHVLYSPQHHAKLLSQSNEQQGIVGQTGTNISSFRDAACSQPALGNHAVVLQYSLPSPLLNRCRVFYGVSGLEAAQLKQSCKGCFWDDPWHLASIISGRTSVTVKRQVIRSVQLGFYRMKTLEMETLWSSKEVPSKSFLIHHISLFYELDLMFLAFAEYVQQAQNWQPKRRAKSLWFT